MFNREYLRGETYVWALQMMMMMMASQAEKVVMTLGSKSRWPNRIDQKNPKMWKYKKYTKKTFIEFISQKIKQN